MLSFGEGQREQTVNSLSHLLCATGFKVDFATLRAHPGFEAGQFYLDPFFLKLLRNRFSPYLTLTF